MKLMDHPPFRILATAATLGLFFLTSCQSDSKRDIRDFYFPLRELEDGLVYEYRSVQIDSLTPAYWYYRSFLQEDGIYMTGTYYEYELEPLQLVREELVSNGMLVQDVKLYEPGDSTGRQEVVEVEVLQGSAFPFEVSDSTGVFLYKIRWEPPQDSGAVITLIKNRRYLKDTMVNVLGEAREAVVFDVQELLEYDQDGVFEQRYGGQEVYARGIGLVYYNKSVGDQMRWDYALHRRYPMTELEKQFEQQLKSQ